MSYKKVTGKTGDRWIKDGKFVPAKDVPEDVKQGAVELDRLDKVCAVCGEPAEHKRMILGMTVGLCDNHYYSVSYGYVAGVLKKKGLYGVHKEESQRSPA